MKILIDLAVIVALALSLAYLQVFKHKTAERALWFIASFAVLWMGLAL